MRDWVLTAIVALLLPPILVNPVLGSYAWAWLSMMNPHKLAFGFARGLPFAYVVAVTTLIAFLFTRKRHALPRSSILVVYLLLLSVMTVTCLFAIAPPETVFERWIFVMKIHLMLFVTLFLVRDRKHLDLLIWVVTFSIAFYGIKGGIWTVMRGGDGRVWGPPGGMVEGNNELAVALVMLMPFVYYLHQTVGNRVVRWATLFCLGAMGFSVLGSQSRGALLALLAIALFLGSKGKYPVRMNLLLIAGVSLAIAFMPDTWSSRMESIGSYEQDNSAMSRIWTWKTLWAAAIDRPLVGVGFAADNATVFARYAPMAPEYEVFTGRVFVAHSIYFQVLGEHGFIALGLFLALGVTTWRTAGRVARQARNDVDYGHWMPNLLRMTQVSLVGYAVGGAFLSLAYFDLPYYLVGYVLICDAMLRQRVSDAVPAPGVASRRSDRAAAPG